MPNRVLDRLPKSLLALGAALSIVALQPTISAAEPFSDLYLGYSMTSDESYVVNGLPLPPSLICVTSCSSAKSPIGGIRVGYWFERLPWLGVAGDFSAFIASWGIESPYEITAFPITPLLMVRARLIKQDGYDNGRVQPYLAVGPSMYITTATVNTGFALIGTAQTDSATSVDIGFDGRLGVHIATAPWFGVILEYRYTYSKPSWDLLGASVRTELSTNNFVVGISAHY